MHCNIVRAGRTHYGMASFALIFKDSIRSPSLKLNDLKLMKEVNIYWASLCIRVVMSGSQTRDSVQTTGLYLTSPLSVCWHWILHLGNHSVIFNWTLKRFWSNTGMFPCLFSTSWLMWLKHDWNLHFSPRNVRLSSKNCRRWSCVVAVAQCDIFFYFIFLLLWFLLVIGHVMVASRIST